MSPARASGRLSTSIGPIPRMVQRSAHSAMRNNDHGLSGLADCVSPGGKRPLGVNELLGQGGSKETPSIQDRAVGPCRDGRLSRWSSDLRRLNSSWISASFDAREQMSGLMRGTVRYRAVRRSDVLQPLEEGTDRRHRSIEFTRGKDYYRLLSRLSEGASRIHSSRHVSATPVWAPPIRQRRAQR